MNRQAAVFVSPSMSFGWIEVLNQAPAVMDVQQLHSSTDRKNREIAIERLVDHRHLGGIEFGVGRVSLISLSFAI